MAGAAGSGISRSVALLAVTLLCAAFVAGVYAAPAPVDVPAFATQQATTENAVANFWGPALEPARQERYAEAPNGSRRVQYFDKARMEEAPSGVTNGLLTVELIHGQRQYGDTLFAAFPPCALPVVGDPDNTWPTYQSLGANLLPERADQSGGTVDTVYREDGTLAHDAKLGAKPGAAPGSYVRDPGGRYAHNIPIAFWNYLNALPVSWLSVMGYPLTEPFWVNVRVNSVKRWVLVQPFERRVLSYTPDNAAAFTVEMGNIGQHYYRWRYTLAPDTVNSPSITPTDGGLQSSTPASSTPRSTAVAVISGVRFGLASSTTASLTFQTDVPATSRIRFGVASHSYQTSQEISGMPTRDHRVMLSDLKPKTRYYFVLHADTDGGGSSESKEGYFATAPTDGTAAATQDASGNPAPDAQPTATVRLSRIAKTATAAENPALPADTLRPSETPRLTETPRPTGTPRPTATETNTPRPPTVTPTLRPPTDTPVPTRTPTPVPTAIPDVHLTISGFAVGSDGSDLTIIQTNAATLAVTLADTTSADTQQATIAPQAWVHDAANVRLVATDAMTTLTMHGRGNAVTVRLDVAVPIRDHNILAFSVTQTVYPSDYGAGKSYTVTKGSSAVPGYHVELHFTVSQ